jgi:hypothetical protein
MKTKHLLNGVAVIAALAFSAPVWAQPANPSGPASASDTTSAAPPTHRHARHVTHAAAHHKMAPMKGSTADQLNQQELARLQTGTSMPPPRPMGAMPPPAPMPNPSGGNSMGMPGPNTGGPGLTPYSTGSPQR